MNIVVLAGGISTERDVSLSSGRQIYNALKENGHNVIMLDVYLGVELDASEKALPTEKLFELKKDWVGNLGAIAEVNPDIESVKALRPDGDKKFFGPNVIEICQSADVVFMALHGENGENGKIQACFDLMGITYTGTDYVSSAMSMDKGIAKDIFKAYGVPTPYGVRLKKEDYNKQKSEGKLTTDIPFPCIVKACCGGSSVGVAIANESAEYEKALAEAFKYDNEVVIEQYIKGREFSVCVMDKKALPIIEIAPKQGFYDYKNKYQAGSTVETCPAELDKETTEGIQRTAEKAFEALRLKNYARFDFMLDSKTNEFYCLEANTLPGMTPTSLVPQEARAVGISFNELCEKIVNTALRED